MLRNTTQTYGSVAIFFHWLLFLLVVVIMSLGLAINLMSAGDWQDKAYFIHKSLGILIFFLAVLRLLWALFNPKPAMPAGTPTVGKWLANIMHALLYLILIVMPINGVIFSTLEGYPPSFFGLFTLQLPLAVNKALGEQLSGVHLILAWTLLVLIILHSAAALSHHYLMKDNILKRMLPKC